MKHGLLIGSVEALKKEPRLEPPKEEYDCELQGHYYGGIPFKRMRIEGKEVHLFRCKICGHEIDDL